MKQVLIKKEILLSRDMIIDSGFVYQCEQQG